VPKEKVEVTEGQLTEMLRDRYRPPEFAFIPQVRNGTGHVSDVRTADAIAMSLWPSRGLDLHGFEIKTNRADWLRELREPRKAEAMFHFFDRFWIVAPKDIVLPGELPPTFGLILKRGTVLRVETEAPKHESERPDKLLLAAILRRAQECVTPEGRIKEARETGKLEGIKLEHESAENARKEVTHLKASISAFEKASGVQLNTYATGARWELAQNRNIGDAVRMVLDGKDSKVRNRLENLLESAEKIVGDIKKTLAEPEPVKGTPVQDAVQV